MTSLKVYKALEELFDSSKKDAEALANYYIIKNYLLGRKEEPNVVSNVPLILQKINTQGDYEYARRETRT